MSRPQLSVVTPIRDGAPLLNDIPGQLRKLADDIEKGEYQWTRAVVLGLDEDEYDPTYLSFGEAFRRRDLIGLFTLAAHMTMTDAKE